MEMPTPDREILSYSAPPTRELPSPLIASLLATPGLFCWTSLFLLMFNLGSSVLPDGRVILLVWVIAVGAAIGSLLFYRRTPKPWYVVLCLAINISGLLFTLAILALALF